MRLCAAGPAGPKPFLQRRVFRRRLVILGAALWVASAFQPFVPRLAMAQEQQRDQTCPDTLLPAGKAPSHEHLHQLLADHNAWLATDGKAGCRADLRGACLDGAKLVKANLRKADLEGATLTGVDLEGANLTGARLTGANLTAAFLKGANLTRADLGGANLTSAWLGHANLTEVRMLGTNLTDARLWLANLTGTVFDPMAGKLPDVSSIALAEGLSAMTFLLTPQALVELREAFKKNGLRQPERDVTFAIRHTDRKRAWGRIVDPSSQTSPARRFFDAIEVGFSFLLFELPSAWGMSPGRPLRILGLLLPLFAVPYWLALQAPTGSEGGIWAVWAADRVNRHEGDDKPVLLTAVAWPAGPGPRRELSWNGALGFALYFSLLSAFHIGWREFNVGIWLTRLQPHEYTLRATRWVRTVSGIQSLVSVYLIALWAVTYFGRPFQ